jgi:tetratricopeptide (TPR) repeat protein
LRPKEPLIWIDLAQLVQPTSHYEALEAYLRATQLMEEKGSPVSMELHHNIGVLQQLLGDLHKAEESFMKALVASCGDEKVAKKEADGENIQPQNVTTCYNIARLHEQCGRADKAKQLYDGIIKEHPSYSDAHLRIGCMSQEQGNETEAVKVFEEAEKKQRKCAADAWALRANIHLEKNEWQPAQKLLEKILAEVSVKTIWPIGMSTALQPVNFHSCPFDF